MKKRFIPLVKNGSYIASKNYTPLVYPGGKTTREVTGTKDNSADKESSESESKLNGKN